MTDLMSSWAIPQPKLGLILNQSPAHVGVWFEQRSNPMVCHMFPLLRLSHFGGIPLFFGPNPDIRFLVIYHKLSPFFPPDWWYYMYVPCVLLAKLQLKVKTLSWIVPAAAVICRFKRPTDRSGWRIAMANEHHHFLWGKSSCIIDLHGPLSVSIWIYYKYI